MQLSSQVQLPVRRDAQGIHEGNRTRIDITFAAERSSIRVGDDVAVTLTPIEDVVSGEEKEVHIVYQKGGFFWNDGAIATTAEMRASHGDLRLSWPGRFAAVAEGNWTNQ